MKWYVLQVLTGTERDVCTALRRKGVCCLLYTSVLARAAERRNKETEE